jgi:hypothetical protein
MVKQLTAEEVRAAIMQWAGLYQTEQGAEFRGAPVSEVPARLRDAGWRNVSRVDESELQALGLRIVRARYVGGARPKRLCQVVVADE